MHRGAREVPPCHDARTHPALNSSSPLTNPMSEPAPDVPKEAPPAAPLSSSKRATPEEAPPSSEPKFSSKRGTNNASQRSADENKGTNRNRKGSVTANAKPSELSKLYAEMIPKLKEEGAAIQEMNAPPAERVAGLSEKTIKAMSVVEALALYGVEEAVGLTDQSYERALEEYGYNELPDVTENKCLKFLSFMWNPLSWVMESAALVAILLSNGPTPWLCNPTSCCNSALFTENQCYSLYFAVATPQSVLNAYPGSVIANCTSYTQCRVSDASPDYQDFLGIVGLLVVNSVIGYYEEEQAGAAVDALMDQLTREYKVKRNGAWIQTESRNLVPGDIIMVKLGDIVPADCKIVKGETMKVDQAALTGESLPVSRSCGQMLLSGSTIKQGENEALVCATGTETEFGKAANLVATTNEMGHLQQVLKLIGAFCCVYIILWVVILCAVLYGGYTWDYRRGIDMVLVILIGGVPIAMPTVLSVTMAIGVNELAKEQAVVTRITAVEELAGMDILCSDKTGTLTKNHLTVMDPTCAEGYTQDDIMLVAQLASRRHGDPDAIDRCIGECASKEMEEILDTRYEIIKFVPFDPVSKRTQAFVRDKETDKEFIVSKGAPQVIIKMAHNADDIREPQNKIIEDYAMRGLRAIAVARSDDGGVKWDYMGVISLSDPPRDDTKDTIQAAVALGIRIIMITGDQVAIGRETARLLGMGLNFHSAHVLKQEFIEGVPLATVIEQCSGWGEVMPEDKYKVVQALRANGHIVGMTGDGVNDAPALKAAHVGIAVADATDAARGAADMVLLTEGLSVIIKAILGSRCIFQRMRNYATYACTTTIRIVTSFGLLACIWRFSYPPFLVLIIAILNDGTIMTVSTDRVQPSQKPDSWRLKDIFIMAFVMGGYLTISTIVFFYIIVYTSWFEDTFGVRPLKYNVINPVDPPSFMLCGVIYLQVSITGQTIIYCTRARYFFFQNRPSTLLMCAFVVAQLTATLIAVYGNAEWTQLYPIGWDWAGIVWVWSLIWSLPADIPKMMLMWIMEGNFSVWGSNFENVFSTKLANKGLGSGRARAGSGTARRESLNNSRRARGSSLGKN